MCEPKKKNVRKTKSSEGISLKLIPKLKKKERKSEKWIQQANVMLCYVRCF